MKFAEINAIFTQKVAEYIAKGYVINSNTMSGHQGEIAKIDLRKSDEIIRVLLDTERGEFFREAVVIIVGKNTDERIAKCSDRITYDTIWNNRLEIIEKRTFWHMQKDYSDVDFYIEGDAGIEAITKSRDRRRVNSWNPHPDKVFENMESVMAKAVKRHLNRSSFKTQNIKKVWKTWNENENRYTYKVQTLKHVIILG